MATIDTIAARGTIALVISQGCFFVFGYFTVVFLARVVQVTLTIFDKNPSDGSDRAKTRITLDNARIAGVQAKGTPSDSASSMTTTQELVKVAPERVTVDDLVAGTSFQFDLLAQR